MSNVGIFLAGILFGGLAVVSIMSKWIVKELNKATDAYSRANALMQEAMDLMDEETPNDQTD